MSYAAPFVWSGGSGNTGLTLTATIRDSAYASVLSGLAGIAEVGATGTYRWYYSAFSDSFTGFVEFLSGATVKAVFPISASDAAIPTDSASIAAIKAKTDTLGTGAVTVVSPVASSGAVTIVRGDDYSNTDSRALEWSTASGTWPDLTGATITFTAKQGGTTLTKAGTVVTPSGVNQKVRVELTALETAIALGVYGYDVQATLLTNGRKITLVTGPLQVLGDVST